MRDLFDELRRHPVPRPRARGDAVDELMIDLASQETYLAGVADALVRKGRVAVQEIRIDATIEARLRAVEAIVAPAEFAELERYQKHLTKLATALAESTNVPLVQFKRPTTPIRGDPPGAP